MGVLSGQWSGDQVAVVARYLCAAASPTLPPHVHEGLTALGFRMLPLSELPAIKQQAEWEEEAVKVRPASVLAKQWRTRQALLWAKGQKKRAGAG